MPETSPPTASGPGLPLFFSRIVGVDPNIHAKLRLDRSVGYDFAATTQFVPLGLEEFEAAAQDYPILFTASPNPIPIALLGLREGENLFLQADGSWKSDTYIPAYVRAFPFVFVATEGSSDLYLGMEANAACLKGGKVGEPLFNNKEPTQVLNEAMGLAAALRNNLIAAEQLARTLDEVGLLSTEEAKIDFSAGGNAIVRGFKVMNRDRLERLNDETWLEWRRRKWLPAIYAHLFSARRWTHLMNAAAAARSGTAQ
jgi:hypothetical protein